MLLNFLLLIFYSRVVSSWNLEGKRHSYFTSWALANAKVPRMWFQWPLRGVRPVAPAREQRESEVGQRGLDNTVP